MFVDELRCFSFDLPLASGSYTMSHGRTLEGIETTVVEIVAEDGTRGYGEACTLGSNYIDAFAGSVQAAVRELAPVALSTDVFEPNVLGDRMDAAVRGHLTAKAAIDAAFWDLRGRLLGVPVCKLLGGRQQQTYRIFFPLSLAAPEQMVDEARRLADQGYSSWQLKLGDDPIVDARRTAAVFEAVGGTAEFITSDANRGWTMAQTMRFLAGIAGVDTYVEQPCRTLGELRQIRARSNFPITADEVICDLTDLVQCVATDAADAMNIKPARVGGLTKAARLRDLAQAAGLMVMVDEPMGGDLASAIIGHLAASCNPHNFLAASQMTATLVDTRDMGTSGGPTLENGHASVSDQPGLGVDVDRHALGEPLFTVEREGASTVGVR